MKLTLALCSAGVLIGSSLFAQAPTETTQATTKTTNNATTKTKRHMATGKVKEYNQGKSIVVTTAKGKDVTFDLTGNNVMAQVDPSVTVGTKVKVVEKTDNKGNKTVTVTPGAGTHHMEKKTGAGM